MVSLWSFVLIIALSAFAVNAAPFAPGHDKRGIQADLYNNFKLFAQYAAATYCPKNINSPGDQLECAAKNCPLVESADSSTVIEYERKDTSTDVTGFVALDHTNKLIVVAFRGSATLDAWRTNLDFDTTDTDICSGCTAHRGFWNSWQDARSRVTPAVQQTLAKYPSYKVVVTGHSLGAAIASLAAASLRNQGLTVALYNYGSPRIGGTKINSYISNQPGGNYRITHWNDPIPRLPLLAMGFVHISPEYYINKPNNQDVSANDLQTYPGAVNLLGNSAWLAVDIFAHQWYFKSMYTCDALWSKRGNLAIRGVEKDVDVVATF